MKDFYLRRYRRLIPALSVMVLFTLSVGFLLLSPFGSMQNTAKTGVGAMLISANLVIERTTGGYFDLAAESNPLLHTWSLSVEEQFYLFYPVVIFAIMFLARGLKAKKFLIIVALFAVTFSSMCFAFTGEGTNFGFYNPFARAWEFGIGALAFLIPKLKEIHRGIIQIFSLFGSALILYSLFFLSETEKTPGITTLAPVLGAALFIHAGKYVHVPYPNSLLSKAMPVWIGNISYSWYLWHWPFIVFSIVIFPTHELVGIIAAALSLLPAYLSKRYIEDKLTPRWNLPLFHKIKYFTLFTLLPLIVAVALLGFANSGFGTNQIESLVSQQQKMHLSVTNGCLDLLEVDNQNEFQCSWNHSTGNNPVYLVGDSHADMFSEGIVDAATSLSFPVSIRTSSGCPFLDIYVRLIGQTLDEANKCRQRYSSTVDWLLQSPPGTVIISNSGDYFMENDIQVGSSIDYVSESTRGDNPISKTEMYVESLAASVELLQDSGFNVLVISPTPHLALRDGWPTNCTTIEILNDGCLQQIDLNLAEGPIQELIKMTYQTTASVGVVSINLNKSICMNQKCQSAVGGLLIFRDGDHISVDMSKSLAPFWISQLKTMG